MHGGKAAHDGAILHRHMPGQCADIGHDDMVAELAIVRHMRIGQQVVVRPNHRSILVPGRTWTVTYSRKVLLEPIRVKVVPPSHFKSCVLNPIEANG